jgi:NAD(P)-dependent dehydrogenase (short-subunit alcohol dehydrogenase family)
MSKRVALVTGAGSGIGRATVERLAKDGYDIVALDLEAEGLKGTIALAEELGARAESHVADICDAAAFNQIIETVCKGERSIDVLVNNAGTGAIGTVLDTEPHVWDRILAVNLTAIFTTCRSVLPRMIARGSGVIVNVSSVSGAFVGQAQRAAYCASKAGVLGLTRSIAADFGSKGVRANAVCPGPVATGWGARMAATAKDPAAAAAAMKGRSAGQASDIAAAIAFLAGNDSTYMNGAAMVVDGGITSTWTPTF